jgi:hypothetical protein
MFPGLFGLIEVMFMVLLTVLTGLPTALRMNGLLILPASDTSIWQAVWLVPVRRYRQLGAVALWRFWTCSRR